MERVWRSRKEIEDDIKTQTKVCKRCGVRKTFDEFKKSKNFADGRYHICSECNSKATKHFSRSRYQKILDLAVESKVCSCCKTRKPFSDYYKDKRMRDGRRGICIDCMRSQNKDNKERRGVVNRCNSIVRLYSITEEEVQEMMNNQKGCCKICNESLSYHNSSTHYSIDHNHITGEVRGLLCCSCNSGLGFLKDSPAILKKALDYLIEKGYYGKD